MEQTKRTHHSPVVCCILHLALCNGRVQGRDRTPLSTAVFTHYPYMPAVCLFVLTTVFKPFIVTKLLQISVSVALSGW